MALTTPAAQVGAIVPEQVRRQLTGRRSDTAGRAFQALLIAAVAGSVAVLGVLVYDMVQTGSGTLTGRLGDFLTGSLRSQPGDSGLLQGLRGTFYIGVFTVVFAFPIGVGAAIYLEEYATKSRLTRFIDLNIRNLAGVPSVVYGILGLAIFVKALGGHHRAELAGPVAHLGRAHAGHPRAAHRDHHRLRGAAGRPRQPARGRLRGRRHPVGGHQGPRPALRRTRAS